MIANRELLNNEYNYYVLYRKLGHRAVEIKEFTTEIEMLRFVEGLEFDNHIIYDMMTSY